MKKIYWVDLQRFAEDEPTPAQTTDPATAADPATGASADPTPAPVSADPATAPITERTFTKSQINLLMKSRMQRYVDSLLKKYGVKDFNEMEGYLTKGRGYDELKSQLDQLTEMYAFSSNNIDPERYDDIKTHFRGKGMTLNSEELAKVLATHPEWARKSSPTTTIKEIGASANPAQPVSNAALASKFLGVDLT